MNSINILLRLLLAATVRSSQPSSQSSSQSSCDTRIRVPLKDRRIPLRLSNPNHHPNPIIPPSVHAQSIDMPYPFWGLDRINQHNAELDGRWDKVDASGVKVYVLDTGIQGDDPDFEGMIDATSDCHRNFVLGQDQEAHPLIDTNGHGTHLASIACGKTFGIADNCKLCAIKVKNMHCEDDLSWLLAGIQFVVDNCNGARCVMTGGVLHGNNFFLHSSHLVSAVASAVNRGVVVVVAGESDKTDACSTSFTGGITVGAAGLGELYDKNNWGRCVDVYAPGVSIISTSDSLYSWSGTSTATAYAVGIVAGHLGNGVPAAAVASEVLGAASAKGFDPEYPEIGIVTIFDTPTFFPTTSPTLRPTSPTLQRTLHPTSFDCLLPNHMHSIPSLDTGPLVDPCLASQGAGSTWVVNEPSNYDRSLYLFYYIDRFTDNVVLEFFSSVKTLHEWHSAGLLIHETLNGQSKFFSVMMGVDLDIWSSWSTCTKCGLRSDNFGHAPEPVWIQLTKAGDTFSIAWRYENTTDWRQLGSQSISWSESFFVGIVVHNTLGIRPAIPEASNFIIRTS